MKLCLLNPLIQVKLMTIIIERMVILAQTSLSSSSSSSSMSSNNHNSIYADSAHPAMKLLNHLRWCDVIYDPKHLINSLLEPISILPKPFQIEIISSLPSLIPEKDTNHYELIKQLQELMETFPELVPSVLECVSNLCLSPDSSGLKIMVTKCLHTYLSFIYIYIYIYINVCVCVCVCVCMFFVLSSFEFSLHLFESMYMYVYIYIYIYI